MVSCGLRWLSLGTLATAAAWCAAGYWFYRDLGTKSLMLAGSKMMAANQAAAPRTSRAASRPAAPNPLGILTFTQPLDRPRGASANPDRGADAPRTAHPGAERRLAAEMQAAEITRQAWGALTAALAGLLAGCGIGMLAAGSPSAHYWSAVRGTARLVTLAAAVTLGIVVGMHAASHSGFLLRLVRTLISLTQSVTHMRIALALLVLAGLSAFASRSRPTLAPRIWMGRAIVVTFVGTLLTLTGVSLLIRYGGFPRLPGYAYALVAIAQSLWAWVLMWALAYVPASPVVADADHPSPVPPPQTAPPPETLERKR